MAPRIYEGGKFILDTVAIEAASADFEDGIRLRVETGGF
jgi:hypothetical protein